MDKSLVSALADDMYQNCWDKKKLCIEYPPSCVNSRECKILGVSSSLNNGTGDIKFQLLGNVDGKKLKYIAYGISNEKHMSGSVVQCFLDSNGYAKSATSVNTHHPMGNKVIAVDGINLEESRFENNMLYCSWTRKANTRVEGVEYDLMNKTYYLLVARGDMADSGLYL
jgi:hypothetical protein